MNADALIAQAIARRTTAGLSLKAYGAEGYGYGYGDSYGDHLS